MSNIFWVGHGNDYIWIMDGYTTTVVDSVSVVGVDNATRGVSADDTNTPWAGGQADKVYIQSGQVTSTLKDSEGVTVDTRGGGTDNANGDTGGFGIIKMLLFSGQITSTVKDSENVTNSSNNGSGISFTSADTVWSTRAPKLRLDSGQFTSTVKTSLATLPDNDITGVGWDGTNTPQTNSSGDKIYLVSGQFTSTVKESADISGSDTSPQGIEHGVRDDRLDLGSFAETHVASGSVVLGGSSTAVWGVSHTSSGNIVLGGSSAASEANPHFRYTPVISQLFFTTDNDTVLRGARSNASTEEILASDTNIWAIAYSRRENMLFYATGSAIKAIPANNENGSFPDTLATGSDLRGVAVDSENGRVYFANLTGNELKYVNFDGTGETDISPAGLSGPQYIEIDNINSKIYWVEPNANPTPDLIKRANLDGSSPETLYTSANDDGILKIALSPEYLYWCDQTSGVFRSDLDGSNASEIITIGNSSGIGYDPARRQILFTTTGVNGTVKQAELDGSNSTTLRTITGEQATGMDMAVPPYMSGTSTAAWGVSYTASGSLLIGGTSTASWATSYNTSGNITLSGSSTASWAASYNTSGNIVLSGSSTTNLTTKHYTFVPILSQVFPVTDTDTILQVSRGNAATEYTLLNDTAVSVAYSKRLNALLYVTGSAIKAFPGGVTNTGIPTTITTGSNLSGVAVDGVNDRIYFTSQTGNTIKYVNYDGTGVTDVSPTGLSNPQYIIIDDTNAKMYWTEPNPSSNPDLIKRANLDGSSPETIYSSPGVASFLQIAVSLEYLYWCNGTSGVWRSDLDGSNGSKIITVTSPSGIIYDFARRQIVYTTTASNGIIAQADVDGANATTLRTFTGEQVSGATASIPPYLSGTSTAAWGVSYTASGGLVISGDSTEEQEDYDYDTTGNIVLSGSSTAVWAASYTSSGGLVLSGDSSEDLTGFEFDASGNIVLSGSSSVSVAYITSATGSITLSGAATTTLTQSHTASGGLVLGGAATTSTTATFSYTASGGLVISGDSTEEQEDYDYDATGSLIIGGSATVASSMAASTGTDVGLVLQEIRDRIVACESFNRDTCVIGIEDILEYPPSSLYCIVDPGFQFSNQPFVNGAGEFVSEVIMNINIIIWCRLALDEAHKSHHWLTKTSIGALDATYGVIDALQMYHPSVATEPIRLLSMDSGDMVHAGYGKITTTWEAKYLQTQNEFIWVAGSVNLSIDEDIYPEGRRSTDPQFVAPEGIFLKGTSCVQVTYGGTPYYKCFEAIASGSLTLGGSSTIAGTLEFAASGGLILDTGEEYCPCTDDQDDFFYKLVFGFAGATAAGSITLGGASTTTESNNYSATATGNITLSGAVTTENYFNFPTHTASGALTLGGAATNVWGAGPVKPVPGRLDVQGSTPITHATYIFGNETGGSITLGGASDHELGATITAAGNVTLGGAALLSLDFDYTASGSITLGGAAVVFGGFHVASGGLTIGGDAVEMPDFYVAVGGLDISGTSPDVWGYIVAAAGSITLGGSATAIGLFHTASGGLTLGGAATTTEGFFTHTASGSITLGGAATTQALWMTASGSITLGGAADAWLCDGTWSFQQASFPSSIDVVLGAGWDGYNGLSEDDVVTLTRYQISSSQASYSEDGTSTPNASTNRIQVIMSDDGFDHKVAANAGYYDTALMSTTWKYPTSVLTTNVSNNFLNINTLQTSITDNCYTFRDVFLNNTIYTGGGWLRVFKSIIKS